MVVAYRARVEDDWIVHKCRLSGRINLDAYAACYQARRYIRAGNAEAQVMDGDTVFARFYKGPTGELVQDGGVGP